ncbi:uncharacterized protein LOC110736772 [Chenopodium quinoa]|nr:uncharacterized protein LOC110736772 [Chenopodium quinoa]
MARHAVVYAVLIVTSAICFRSGYAQDPGQLLIKALSCFNADNIYSRCSEAYRLTQSGYLNIPPAATEQFCYGPCLAETHLVLDCVDHSLSKFVFYNKATINDVRTTLQAACGHTHERGNFNVEEYMQEYMQDYWSGANLPLLPNNLFTLIFLSSTLILMIREAL